jgi:signal transduction histidine kinase
VTDVVFEPALASAPTAAGAVDRRLRRLALDVHDGPMQSLVAIGYGLQDLRRRLEGPRETEGAVDQLDLMVAELVGAEQGLRSLITTLDDGATSFDTLDVIAAREVERFGSRSGAATEVVVQSGCRPDSHSQEIAISSVLREALTNVAKHAEACNVVVRLEADEERILLHVEDDGRGFDPDAVSADRIGLASMHDRLGLIGGDLSIATRPGGPTVVTALFRRWQRPTD